MNAYSKSDIIHYLSSAMLAPSKNRGQNFLTDENTASSIANTALLTREKRAIEIGGGLGSLTGKLYPIYKENLTIVEYDRGLYNYLASVYENVTHMDILNFEIKNKSDVYGNIPYNIASPILEWLFVKNYGMWNYAVMMVQTDFAKRILAKEGEKDYSSLSMFSYVMCHAKLEFNVSRSIFYPSPKVDSSVVSFIPKDVDKKILPLYRILAKALFHGRRKMAKNNLTNSPYIKLDKNIVSEMFETLKIESKVRGEDISGEILEKMAKYLIENGSFIDLPSQGIEP